jgi:DNA-binding NarL/FixJ family response regulator
MSNHSTPSPLAGKLRKLMLVDNQPIIRAGVQALIEAQLPTYQLYITNTCTGALKLARKTKPTIAVIDLALPDGCGIDLIRDLRAESPYCEILVLSMRCELRFGPRALKAGAKGYLMKSSEISALYDAIRMIELGRTYCSLILTDWLLNHHHTLGEMGVMESLSGREFQIFQAIGGGASTKEIAQRLGISPKTVDSHRENIKIKLGCASSIALTLAAHDWLHQDLENTADA